MPLAWRRPACSRRGRCWLPACSRPRPGGVSGGSGGRPSGAPNAAKIPFVALILVAGLLLFAWPAEHLPLVGDSAIYPNTAARLIRDRGLVYRYTPLDGLSLVQKQLFYVPADAQLSNLKIRSYQGLLYGAYYVMDPEQDRVVSSRPPLVITWMALFGKLFGPKGMLYVTPLFGALSLVMLYFLGKGSFRPRRGRAGRILAAAQLPAIALLPRTLCRGGGPVLHPGDALQLDVLSSEETGRLSGAGRRGAGSQFRSPFGCHLYAAGCAVPDAHSGQTAR